jgi:hypothetical protein
MKLRRMALAAATIAALGSTAAWAAGLWSTLPIIGGASFCAGQVTGATGQICGLTVPAGPASLTGAEHFPADTGLAGGGSPQTAVVTTCQLGAGAYTVVSPVGSANTIPNQVCFYNLTNSGTVAAMTFTMPSAPLDGQILRIVSDQTVTASQFAPGVAGTRITNVPTSMTAGVAIQFVFSAANNTWYRFQ